MKASINGPNRRKNRTGDKTIASDFDLGKSAASNTSCSIKFKVKSLERYFETNRVRDSTSSSNRSDLFNKESIGDACLFTVRRKKNNDGGGEGLRNCCSGQQLLEQHFQLSKSLIFVL